MKFLSIVFFVSFLLPQEEELGFNSLYEKEVEFMGLNFSKAKFIGSSHFTNRNTLKEEYFEYWNEYMTNHYHKNNLNNALNLDQMVNRNSICKNSYEKIDKYALITDDPYRLRTDQVQECLDELDYDKVDKIGICFVVESFDYSNQIMTIWFTLVDMNNNQLIFQKKLLSEVRKGSGRDLWANGISTFINKTLAQAHKSWK
jgi:hypothetical protein